MTRKQSMPEKSKLLPVKQQRRLMHFHFLSVPRVSTISLIPCSVFISVGCSVVKAVITISGSRRFEETDGFNFSFRKPGTARDVLVLPMAIKIITVV